MHLRFITGNAAKVRELATLLPDVTVTQEPRGYPEIQADTLREVTEAGARHLLDDGLEPPFVLEDSGLFVAALHGFPGVYSRYVLDTIGIPGLLSLLRGHEGVARAAAFRADVAYVDAAGVVHHHEGVVHGRIAARPGGTGGFGFDPVFVPDGETRTFAQMSAAEKAALSHRGQAARRLAVALVAPGKAANR